MYKEFVDLQYRYKTIRRIKKKYLTKKYLVIISEYKTGKLSVHRRTKRTKAERKRVVPPRLYGNISTACSPRGNHSPREQRNTSV